MRNRRGSFAAALDKAAQERMREVHRRIDKEIQRAAQQAGAARRPGEGNDAVATAEQADTITIIVPGTPQPGGSKRAFAYQVKGAINHKTGGPLYRASVTEDNVKSSDWRATVRHMASIQCRQPLQGPLAVSFFFRVARPRGHFNAKGMVTPGKPAFPDVRPDTTKLMRSTEDALKGIVWADDCQVVKQYACKDYGMPTGCVITVRRLPARS